MVAVVELDVAASAPLEVDALTVVVQIQVEVVAAVVAVRLLNFLAV